MNYHDYLEARETIWQMTPIKLKEQIIATKDQLARRKEIMERERRNPQVSNKEKKTAAIFYWQKYDELCKLEEQAGLTEVAKNFCKAQAVKCFK